MKKPVIYLIGSLRNAEIPVLGNKLRELGFEVFDDWFSPGPEADDFWRKYEKIKGSTYKEALNGWAGKHIFAFDKYHIDRADIGVLYMPAGKSGHLELGYMIGQGKKCFMLFDEEPQDRWDVMLQFCESICFNFDELKDELLKLLPVEMLYHGIDAEEELMKEFRKSVETQGIDPTEELMKQLNGNNYI